MLNTNATETLPNGGRRDDHRDGRREGRFDSRLDSRLDSLLHDPRRAPNGPGELPTAFGKLPTAPGGLPTALAELPTVPGELPKAFGVSIGRSRFTSMHGISEPCFPLGNFTMQNFWTPQNTALVRTRVHEKS